ncbi:hypothetical protein L4C33_08590 [Vibrio makurazakiensis]|uniref:hypothetical protein n=1 Tax=Vibrio makurazakiensis TaxID=2910250 RepID=UPI003D145702
MHQRVLVKKASKFKVILNNGFFLSLYAVCVTWAANLLVDGKFAYGYVVLSLLCLAVASFLCYENVRRVTCSDYELNDLGIKSGQVKNKEYGDIVPWSYIKTIEIKKYNRSNRYYIEITLNKPLKMRFMFGFAYESDFIFSTVAQQQSTHYLYEELLFFKQQVETSNG